MGGAVLNDSFEWGASMPAILAAPPDKATVGEGWLEQWKAQWKSFEWVEGVWIVPDWLREDFDKNKKAIFFICVDLR